MVCVLQSYLKKNVASTFEIVDALSLKKSDDLATLLNSLKEILC